MKTATQRHQGLILRDITATYGHLHPDSLDLDCDGDRKAMTRRASYYQRKLATLFAEIGRTVTEAEAWATFGTFGTPQGSTPAGRP